MNRYARYKKGPTFRYPERTWPDRSVERAPVWASVDLRDGNLALIDLMSDQEKLEMFRLLTGMGIRQIEVGHPASSRTDFGFVHKLIKEKRIPENVTIQVLSKCDDEQIEVTMRSLRGCRRAIVHIFHPVSDLHRELFYSGNEKAIMRIAERGAMRIREMADAFPGEITLEYSPENFTQTDPAFALSLCEKVISIWEPTPEKPMIINLPATMETEPPNVYADRIEWMHRHLSHRDSIILSAHVHNDRGGSAAAAELALLAGAQRIEGTLMGNGERTGNTDLITMACNLMAQGVDPGLDLHDVSGIVEVYERCTRMHVDERHPYVGRLVYTAFSPMHQEAIKRGFEATKKARENGEEVWKVPYLPIDPAETGRVYEPVVEAGSQRSKSSAVSLLARHYGFKIPAGMHREFADCVRKTVQAGEGAKLSHEQVMDVFRQEYMYRNEPLHFRKLQVTELGDESASGYDTRVKLTFTNGGQTQVITAEGNGPLDAVQRGLLDILGISVRILDYEEHALGSGSDAQAAAYIHLIDNGTGKITYGAGVSSNITRASVRAVFSAINRLRPEGELSQKQ